MYNETILMSPIAESDKEPLGYYFEVMSANGGISRPNGIHHTRSMAEKTQSSYIKDKVLLASSWEMFEEMKNWYIDLAKYIKYAVIDSIEFGIKETVENIEGAFPEEKD